MALLWMVLGFALVWPATQHLRMEAISTSAEVDFLPGHPIVWTVGGALLTEHLQLANLATQPKKKDAAAPVAKGVRIGEAAEIEFAAIKDSKTCIHTVRAKVSLHGNDLMVELERHVKPAVDVKANNAECSQVASPLAILDRGDGKRRGIDLPAQLRLTQPEIADGLTLEFRGDLRVGNDVSSSRQPLLKSGSLALWELRSEWPEWLKWLRPMLVDTQFEIERRDLGLGDKVWIAAPTPSDSGAEMPQGFVRISKADAATEMTVYATTLTSLARVVHPFRQAETPKAHWLKRLWADELITKVGALIVAWLGASALLPAAGPEHRAETSALRHRRKPRRNQSASIDPTL